jgi:hypothetical protein
LIRTISMVLMHLTDCRSIETLYYTPCRFS